MLSWLLDALIGNPSPFIGGLIYIVVIGSLLVTCLETMKEKK